MGKKELHLAYEFGKETGVVLASGLPEKYMPLTFDSWYNKNILVPVEHENLIFNNTYWVYYEEKWHPVRVSLPYDNETKYFKFLNGMTLKCTRVKPEYIHTLSHD